ncbi:MAG: hypothetical protein AMXMBFR58_00010 [Phycisphaerae bacterium]
MLTIEDRCARLEVSNRRQRAAWMVTTVLGIVVIAGGAGQPGTTPDVLRARTIELVAPSGERVAVLGFNAELRCGELSTFGVDGSKKVWIGAEPAQQNGALETYGRTGKPLAGLYADDNTGSGALGIRNAAGSQIHYTSGDKDGNAQSLSLNAAGRPIQKLSCTSKGAGWLSVRGADGTPLVQLGGANEDGNGVLLVGRTNNKPAAQLKGYSGFGVLSLFDDAGRVRVRVAATDEHGGRVGVVTPAGKTWSWWPATPESAASTTDHALDLMDEILNGIK